MGKLSRISSELGYGLEKPVQTRRRREELSGAPRGELAAELRRIFVFRINPRSSEQLLGEDSSSKLLGGNRVVAYVPILSYSNGSIVRKRNGKF